MFCVADLHYNFVGPVDSLYALMPKIPKKKATKKVAKKVKPKAKLVYVRFRLDNHCRCGGTTEIILQPGRDGYAECAMCATYVSISPKAAYDILQRYL